MSVKAILFSLFITLAVLGCGSSRYGGFDFVVPPPEIAPTAADSIVIINHVVYWTTLEVNQVPEYVSSVPDQSLLVNFKLHLENHSDEPLNGFKLPLITIYQLGSDDPLGTFRLTLQPEDIPIDVAIHSLKNLEYWTRPLTAKPTLLPPGSMVYGRFQVSFNKQDYFVNTRPVPLNQQAVGK